MIHVFEAELDDWEPDAPVPVSRKLALPGTKTLADLHLLLQAAFGWADDHLYSFWLDGEFWGAEDSEYTAPFDLEGAARSSEVRLDTLDLERGQRIAYIFDFGDEWRVALTLRELREHGDIGILESKGEAPPQYPDPEDDEGPEDAES